ncbi:hypothetical protein SAMN03159463_05525 [Mesorhizobium sp. NFR06]|jgi:hypothetical protein|nr:hypothetical protein SAMN03159463_05525 [Mesorhizobium sp. NFR06]
MNPKGEQTRSLWMKVEVDPAAPRFSGTFNCDTVIIGSGIAGLSVAYEQPPLVRPLSWLIAAP